MDLPWASLAITFASCHTEDVFFGMPVAGNLLNAILDPILIFIFGLGIGGAAIATVISEYVMMW